MNLNLDSPLEKLRRALKELLRAVRDREHDEHWAEILSDLSAKADSLDPAGIESRDAFAREIQSIYGGMGSFNDTIYSSETSTLQAKLYTRSEDEARYCWRSLGRPWHEISPAELFREGAIVQLVEGEVVVMNPGGAPRSAPRSPLSYRVIAHLENDVDNMPRYQIQADSHIWFARHNALRSVPAL